MEQYIEDPESKYGESFAMGDHAVQIKMILLAIDDLDEDRI